MRTIAATDTRLATAKARAVHVKLTVTCIRGASWSVELTNLEGRNWLKSLEHVTTTDDPVASVRLSIIREAFNLSLAPLVSSKLNRVAGTATVLLQPRRRIKIETQVAPLGAGRRSAGTWLNIFEGEIFDVDPGTSTDSLITVQAIDDGAILKRFFNYTEQPPKAVSGSAVSNWYTAITFPVALETFIQNVIDGCITGSNSPWVTATAYAVGQIRRPTTRNGFCYRVTAIAGTGTSGGAEPTWPTYIGGTVIDNAGANQVTWACHYDQLPTLYTPVATGINLDAPAADAPLVTQSDLGAMLRSWAMANALDLRMRYDEGTFTWRLTLAVPEGDSTSLEFGPDVCAVRSARYSDADVRNVVAVPWRNKGASPERVVSVYADAASRVQFGSQYFQLGEQDCVAIDSQGEADTLGDRLIKDLAWPALAVEAEVPYYPWLEVGDGDVLLPGDTSQVKHPLWTSQLTCNVLGIRHAIDGNGARTTLTLAGIVDGPVAPLFKRHWMKLDVRAKMALFPALAGANGIPVGPSLQNALGACFVQAQQGSAQSIATDTWTKLNVDTIVRDFGGDFAVGTYKFTAPVAGRYTVSASMEIGGMGASDLAVVGISANGITFVCQGEVTASAGKTGALQATCEGTVDMLAGNSLYVYGYHDHGSNLTVASGATTRFTARRVS